MPESVATSAPVVDTPTEVEIPTKSENLAEDNPSAGNENIVDGPTKQTAELSWNDKKKAKVLKEGGKRGIEIEGAADMGGLQFFCTMMEKEITEGKVEYLIESMKAMNAISDPTEEERKGGAGKLGKMIFSFAADESKLSAVAYVPKDKSGEVGEADKVNAKEWLLEVAMNVGVKKSIAEDKIITFEESDNICSSHWAAIQIEADGENDIFPIKMRDPAISMAYNFLKSKGLFPVDDDEDDDEYVFGDDDFP